MEGALSRATRWRRKGIGVTEQRYTIGIDREICMGTGVCAAFASNTFAVDDDTKVTVINPTGDPLSMTRAAESGCPTGAITLTFAEATAE